MEFGRRAPASGLTATHSPAVDMYFEPSNMIIPSYHVFPNEGSFHLTHIYPYDLPANASENANANAP